MTGTTYRSKYAFTPDSRKYRINYAKGIVEYTTNAGILWHRSMYSMEEMQRAIRVKHMVEEALV
jgi:hypothetical protein